jgi:hypothetical protein
MLSVVSVGFDEVSFHFFEGGEEFFSIKVFPLTVDLK